MVRTSAAFRDCFLSLIDSNRRIRPAGLRPTGISYSAADRTADLSAHILAALSFDVKTVLNLLCLIIISTLLKQQLSPHLINLNLALTHHLALLGYNYFIM